VDVLVELRSRHEKGEVWAGVDVLNGKVGDMAALDVFEPLAVKEQIVTSASEAASMIIRIDDVIAAGKDQSARRTTHASRRRRIGVRLGSSTLYPFLFLYTTRLSGQNPKLARRHRSLTKVRGVNLFGNGSRQSSQTPSVLRERPLGRLAYTPLIGPTGRGKP